MTMIESVADTLIIQKARKKMIFEGFCARRGGRSDKGKERTYRYVTQTASGICPLIRAKNEKE